MAYDIPFNFNPESTFVRTIPYTIPAGYFAKVVPMGVWFEIGGNVFGFKEKSYDHTTSNIGTAFSDTLYTNTTGTTLMVETNIIETPQLSGDNYVAIYAGTIENINFPVGTGGGTNPLGWQGFSEYRHVETGQLGIIKRSHIFTLPPDHTLRRDVLHNQPFSAVTNIRVWSEVEIKGEFWFPGGTDIDGDKFIVQLYKAAT